MTLKVEKVGPCWLKLEDDRYAGYDDTEVGICGDGSLLLTQRDFYGDYQSVRLSPDMLAAVLEELNAR